MTVAPLVVGAATVCSVSAEDAAVSRARKAPTSPMALIIGQEFVVEHRQANQVT